MHHITDEIAEEMKRDIIQLIQHKLGVSRKPEVEIEIETDCRYSEDLYSGSCTPVGNCSVANTITVPSTRLKVVTSWLV
jgi:hypothetical protein